MLKVINRFLGTKIQRLATFSLVLILQVLTVTLSFTLSGGYAAIVSTLTSIVILALALISLAAVGAILNTPYWEAKRAPVSTINVNKPRRGALRKFHDSYHDSLEMHLDTVDESPLDQDTPLEIYVAAIRVDIDQLKQELQRLRVNE
jgi:hypothetical protein